VGKKTDRELPKKESKTGNQTSIKSNTIDAMRTVLLAAGFLALSGFTNPPHSLAQSAAQAPKFEVSSIRPCESEGGRSQAPDVSPGRINTHCQTVMALIQRAYVTYANGQSSWSWSVPISGGPAWIDSTRYTIEAKAVADPPSDIAPSGILQGPMMQALLEDRFKLKVHRETRQVPVYALTVLKSGLKLHAFQAGSCTPRNPGADMALPLEPGQKPYCDSPAAGGPGLYGLRVQPPQMILNLAATSLTQFARFLRLDRTVLDRTGVTGLFDFRLEYAFDSISAAGFLASTAAPADAGDTPSIFTAIQEQLGLKLEPTNGPSEFLNIHSVERPSEN
jgi:uncharacterized protein (TIGR03435 family)